MTNHIEFKLSAGSWVGLAVIAFSSVAMFACSMVALHPAPRSQQVVRVQPANCDCDNLGNLASGVRIGNLPAPVRESAPPVNSTARDEVKQQSNCIPCQLPRPAIAVSVPLSVSNYANWPAKPEAEAMAKQLGATLKVVSDPKANAITVYAQLPSGSVWNTTNSPNTQIYSGVNCFLAVLEDMRRGIASPAATTPGGSVLPLPPSVASTAKGRHQLTLFLSANDPESAKVLEWFGKHPQLKALKESCSSEIFTEESPMYKAKFASVVQPKDFPAILFCDSDGGYIYAVGRPMLPPDSDSLLADIRAGLKLAQSVEQAPVMTAKNGEVNSGVLKTQGHNWDEAISYQMQLNQLNQQSQDPPSPFGGDCVDRDGDGQCDTDRQPWGQGQRINDLLNRDKEPSNEAVIWASGFEIAQVILSLVVVALVAAIAYKLLRK